MLISLLITILILGLIVGLAFWIIDQLPFIPANFKQVAKVIIGVIVLLYLLGMLGGFAPYPQHWRLD